MSWSRKKTNIIWWQNNTVFKFTSSETVHVSWDSHWHFQSSRWRWVLSRGWMWAVCPVWAWPRSEPSLQPAQWCTPWDRTHTEASAVCREQVKINHSDLKRFLCLDSTCRYNLYIGSFPMHAVDSCLSTITIQPTFPEGLFVEAGYMKMPPYLSVRCISATMDPT